MKKAVVVLLLLFASIMVYAGPFGIEMGWSVEGLKENKIAYELYSKSGNISIYEVFPLNPHPDFSEYYIWFDSGYGIYMIEAYGDYIDTTPDGAVIKREYEKIRDQISFGGGDPEEYDYLAEGSSLDQPNDWMNALLAEERYLISYWVQNYWLPIVMSLSVLAESDTVGYLCLHYEYDDETIIDEIYSKYYEDL
jgi:hypothetical protein